MPIYSKNCTQCGNRFEPRIGTQSHCSMACAYKTISDKRRNRVICTCQKCGKNFETKAYAKDTAKYCSKACWSTRRIPNLKTCPRCNNEFDTPDKRKIYCSQECRKNDMVGENAAAYKHGQSNRDRDKHSLALRLWRISVFSRDGYQCVTCGTKGKIHAHHIKSWADFPEHRFDVDNGATLCEKCHGLIHGKNFATRRNKKCPTCGNKTTGRGVNGRCKSCAGKESYTKNHLSK